MKMLQQWITIPISIHGILLLNIILHLMWHLLRRDNTRAAGEWQLYPTAQAMTY